MKIDNINSNAAFGWNYNTHAKITSQMIDEIPELAKFKKILVESVKKPDFDERGFKSNTHFYYTPTLHRTRESFLDFDGKHNAYAKFGDHIFKFEYILDVDADKAMEHAGRALHFLQDVTQPHHTERGSVLQKWLDLKAHKKFESFVLQNEDYLLSRNKANKAYDVDVLNPFDLFEHAVGRSINKISAKNDNKLAWKNIAVSSLSDAVEITKDFGKYLVSMLNRQSK